jgi:hypothetical protein
MAAAFFVASIPLLEHSHDRHRTSLQVFTICFTMTTLRKKLPVRQLDDGPPMISRETGGVQGFMKLILAAGRSS